MNSLWWRSMLGRGVKRKWSCLEELEAEMVPAAVTEEKEQHEEVELVVLPSKTETNHLQQRQLVLGLCLEKLQRYQVGMELSLRRSVLLINTLRQIQEDIQSDGGGARSPDAPLHGGVHPDSRLLRDDIREDVPVTCPGCAEGDRDDLPLSPPLSPEFPSQETNSSADQQKPLPAATTSAFSDAVNAMGYLSDLTLDDIFEDIDTSMYETSDLPPAWSTSSLWPVSVSLWADEDVKMRSPGHGSPGSLQSCLMDLNELDHIMEILVKSWPPGWSRGRLRHLIDRGRAASQTLMWGRWWSKAPFDILHENEFQSWCEENIHFKTRCTVSVVCGVKREKLTKHSGGKSRNSRQTRESAAFLCVTLFYTFF